MHQTRLAPVEETTEDLISWEEAEWTRQALGLSIADFSRLLGVSLACVNQGRKNPQSILRQRPALMLRLGTNRKYRPGGFV